MILSLFSRALHIIFRRLSSSSQPRSPSWIRPYLKYSNSQTRWCQKRFCCKVTNYMQHRCDVGKTLKIYHHKTNGKMRAETRKRSTNIHSFSMNYTWSSSLPPRKDSPGLLPFSLLSWTSPKKQYVLTTLHMSHRLLHPLLKGAVGYTKHCSAACVHDGFVSSCSEL